MKKPKIALVLSGGAALGFAHLGVVEELIKAGIKPDIVVGTSMGAIVGGAYAAGLSVEEMIQYAYKMNVFKFVDVNFNKTGMFSGTKINKLLEEVFKDITADQCLCKFVAIAADIIEAKQVVLESGKVKEMVRASMNIPGLLVPIEQESNFLIDGGVLNNYPDDVAKNLGADIIIGVDVLRNSYPNTKPKNLVVSLFNSLTMLQMELYKYKPTYTDVLIAPDLSKMAQMDFKKESIDYALEVGREEGKKQINQIKEVIRNWKNKK